MKGTFSLTISASLIFSAQLSWAQLKVATNGSVGIGIESPQSQSKLHVVHNNYYAGYFTSNKASSSTKVLRAEYTSSSDEDAIAVYGKSVPTAYYGIGGYFEGGYIGLQARSTISGEDDRYGIRAYAWGGEDTNYGIYAYGTGGETSYAGFFNGNVHVTGNFSNPSDISLKENINSVGSVLTKLMKLKAKSFNFKSGPEYKHFNLASGKRYGFIAQELEKIYPELVSIEYQASPGELEGEKDDEPPTAYKAINYIEIIPILVKAIQEQQKEIDELKGKIGN